MARTKAFDPEQAVSKAMDVFWRQGYEATTLPDLLAGMGIARASLYDTFGDKHALFLAALARYEENKAATLVARLDAATAEVVVETIREVFLHVRDEAVADAHRRGCLMDNAIAERAARDDAVALVARQSLGATEDAFYRALMRAQEQDACRADRDPRALARFLVAALQGLRLRAKVEPDRAVLGDIVDVTLAAIG